MNILVDIAFANTAVIILAGAAQITGLATTPGRRLTAAVGAALLTALLFALANDVLPTARNVATLLFIALQLVSTALGVMTNLPGRVAVPAPEETA